jgi:signal transduction histidine kinase
LEKTKVEVGIELHDNISQLLTGVIMFIKMYDKNNKNEYLIEAEELLAKTINEVRNLSHTLSAPDFKEESLEKVLLKLAQQTAAGAGFTINTIWNVEDITFLPQKLALNIYRIIQEQFNNIHKHAKAKNVELQLQKIKNNIILTIKDDGIGFDVLQKKNGIGLTNIKTRASFFNGSTNIISSPGQGCTVEINFNINN